jgi:hypothetical protein
MLWTPAGGRGRKVDDVEIARHDSGLEVDDDVKDYGSSVGLARAK